MRNSRLACSEKRQVFGGLQARASADSQSKLAGEKAALVSTVRSLNRHVAKVEGFKRNLLTSLQASDEARLL